MVTSKATNKLLLKRFRNNFCSSFIFLFDPIKYIEIVSVYNALFQLICIRSVFLLKCSDQAAAKGVVEMGKIRTERSAHSKEKRKSNKLVFVYGLFFACVFSQYLSSTLDLCVAENGKCMESKTKDGKRSRDPSNRRRVYPLLIHVFIYCM